MRIGLDTFSEIGYALTRNKSRTFLTGFGIFWGIFMLLALMGAGDGLKESLNKNFEGFATNSTFLISDRTSEPYAGFREGRYWRLNHTDVERLKIMVPGLETVTPMCSRWGETAMREENSYEGSIKGVRTDYANIETPKIRYGRYLNEIDVLQERKVCVIGKTIYQQLFPEGGDPCGQYIKVGPAYYCVVGVDYNSGNVSISGTADESISIPLSVFQKVYNIGNDVDLICLTGKSGVKMSSMEDDIRAVMASAHKYSPTDKQALFILNTEQMFGLMDTLFMGVDFLIILIGLGTILAGAIGVSNIMMVTVKERTTEIGIRRAIGATPRDILGQIIMESISITSAAGVLGIVFSVGVLAAAESLSTDGTTYQIGFGLAFAALLLVIAVGIVAGLAPASRAMHIKPVDAMRDE